MRMKMKKMKILFNLICYLLFIGIKEFKMEKLIIHKILNKLQVEGLRKVKAELVKLLNL